MNVRTMLQHLYKQGKITDYQFTVINRNLKDRPQGEWIYNRPNTQTGANIFRCSICNHETQSFTCGIKNPKFDNYCGNCGADMRGDKND